MRTIRQPKRWLWLVGLGLLLTAAWPALAGSLRPGQGGIRVYLPLLSRPLDVPPLSWDPRLTARGAVVIPATVAPGQGYWRLVRAQWYAENEEPFAGQHHILMDTLDRDGQRQPGAPIAVYAIVGPTYITKVTTEAKPGEPYAANFPMYEVAPFYRVEPSDGAPADAVSGLGMGSLEYPDWKIHTSYGLVWQWTLAPAATQTPTASPTPSATPSATASPVGTETATVTVTATATSTAEPSSTPTATPSVTASPVEPSATPVLTATTTETPTPTPSPSATATATLTATDTIAPSATASPTGTATPAATETPTPTPSPSATATPTRWPQVTLAPRLNGADHPVQVTHAGDGSGLLFVVEQTGRIRIFRDGAFLPTSFLDVSGRITCCGERGLLGLAFSPDYAASGRFYVNYTNLAGHTVVARYRIGVSPDVAVASSEQIVLTVPQPYSNHNGGQIAFGPDGTLYIGMGDGGSAGDPGNRAQNPAELLGKLLRIDVTTGDPATYTIPPSNPFTQTAGYRGEIWAVGLRNPWRFAFDRQTGDLYIGDVGQAQYEEINFQPAGSPGGQNYGWRIMEGTHCYNATTCASAGLILPVWEYDHGQGCSVTGGFVYRGADYAAMQGTYFYADYCQGKIWGLRRDGTAWRNVLLFDAPFAIATFGEDEAGRLYVADYSGGVIYEIVDGVP